VSADPPVPPGPDAHEPADSAAPPSPRDQARQMLDRARRSAPPHRRRPRRVPAEEQRWSGAAPDGRDPAPMAASVGDLVRDRDWERPLRAAGILARWDTIVGSDIAAHCRPERLEAGVLTCVAESTSWATQLRLLAPRLLERIRADLGPGVVEQLRVHGPTAPDWRHGPLRVTGRGPRDTYG